MSKIKLDLSQFKHVRSNAKTTTLQHKAGHELTIAHNSLSPEGKAQLTQLAKISETPLDADEMNHKMAKGGKTNAANQKLAESKKTPPSNSYVMPSSTPMADGGNIADTTSPEDKEALANYIESGPQSPEALKQATTIDPKMVEDAQNMAMGTVGAVKEVGQVAAIPQNIGPAIQDTATKLAQAMQKYGPDHQVVRTLSEKLNGLHSSLRNYMPNAGGGAVGYEKGGKIPPALDPDAEPSVTDVPDTVTPSDQPAMTPEQKAYQQGHDAFLRPAPGVGGLVQMARQGFSKEERERNAAEAGINNVNILHEDQAAEQAQKDADAAKTAKINTQLSALGMAPLPGTNTPTAVNSVPDQPQMPQVANSAPLPQMPQDEFAGPEGMMMKGYQQTAAGLQKEAEAQTQQGREEQLALERDEAAKNLAQNMFNDHFNELDRERRAHEQDILNGHIDPEQYWKGVYNPATKQYEGGHSKLMAALGMIVAGFDPMGRPNAAVQMLQYQMNRNLEAQKANLQSKQNLLTANLHQFQNMRDATDMTRLMQNDMVTNYMRQAAAKATNPLAQAALLKGIGQLNMSMGPLMQQFALRRAAMSLAGNPGTAPAVEHTLNYMAASGNPEAMAQAKELRERYIPNLGIASTPVPQEVKDRVAAYQNVERLMNQSLQFAKEHEYNLNSLSPTDRAAGETLRGELMSQIRTAEKQGVYKESEAKFMQGMLGGNPSAFFNALRTQPKLMEMQRLKTNEYHNLLQNLGGNLLKNAQSVSAQVHSAQSNPLEGRTITNKQTGQRMIMRNGQWSPVQ